jgi:hypothetical protein
MLQIQQLSSSNLPNFSNVNQNTSFNINNKNNNRNNYGENNV